MSNLTRSKSWRLFGSHREEVVDDLEEDELLDDRGFTRGFSVGDKSCGRKMLEYVFNAREFVDQLRAKKK